MIKTLMNLNVYSIYNCLHSFSYFQKETVEFSKTHNEERRLRELNTELKGRGTERVNSY